MTNEKNMTSSILWDLNRLSGFDFMKFTQLKDTGEGKKDLFMSLEGQKTWFRLACPNGGLVLNALRVTDAMAMFEARVFADANDRNPLASSTATKKADKATGNAYIRNAQDAALGEALKSAGFCLQVSVLAHIARDAQTAQAEDAGQPAEAPEEAPKPSPDPAQADAPKLKEGQQPAAAVSQPKSVTNTIPVQGAPKQKAGDNSQPPVDKAGTPPKPDSAPRPAPIDPQPHAAVAAQPSAPVAPQPHAPAEIQFTPVTTLPDTAPAPASNETTPVVDITTRQPVTAGNQPAGPTEAEAPSEPAPQAAPAAEPALEAAPGQTEAATYTADMTVEEIIERMTLEQAKAIIVPGGTCKGWTLEQVAKDRPPSLKWLRYTAPFANNELKAAAGIVLNDLELKMAG